MQLCKSEGRISLRTCSDRKLKSSNAMLATIELGYGPHGEDLTARSTLVDSL